MNFVYHRYKRAMWDRRLCFASLRGASQSRPRLSAQPRAAVPHSLYMEPYVDDIAVAHDVVAAFNPNQALPVRLIP